MCIDLAGTMKEIVRRVTERPNKWTNITCRIDKLWIISVWMNATFSPLEAVWLDKWLIALTASVSKVTGGINYLLLCLAMTASTSDF
jgi:hypothetical protein